MASSILLILSCVPTAIISFYYGLKVNSSFLNGKYDEAETYTQKAKFWIRISVAIGAILLLISLIYVARLYNEMGPVMDKEMQKLLRE